MSTPGIGESQLKIQHVQIIVTGNVDPSWSVWFCGLRLRQDRDKNGFPITRLTGKLPDQGALRGVLNKLWDLNLTLLSVKCKYL